MDIASKESVKNLLENHKTRPEKKFGQNFLINKGAIEKLICAANLSKDDLVLEIGPGIGNLTQELAKRVGKVLAIEKDEKMIEILKETLADFGNVEVVQEDARKINLKSYIPNSKSYKVLANLPFYLTAPIIRKFLEVENPPDEMVFIIQKEVAQRICAKVPDMNLLAVSVQFYAKPEIISYISKKSFWPQPKVDSAIIRISRICTNLPRIGANLPQIDTDSFFKVVKAGFSQPRKQLVNNLSKGLDIDKEKAKSWLQKNNIDHSRRAETLTLSEWENLAKSV
ncbi:MAG: 16S rRNA (adenine(1518)-N(6)/adenine(1519)-N(6))-dimethyltransferase RsmA [Candidatus Pacebacteria bacterium]|nr:16S rRNA (adenine(1518)-N(6)/adenine(1519)-N(6))-dimethyltransferase RsmA [Candidatus Paceibacterota bacterium]